MDNIEKMGNRFHAFDILQALAVLEELRNNCFPGRKINFTADFSLCFPQNDMGYVSADENEITVRLPFPGLTGASSPLPMYFSDYIARGKEGSDSLADFLQIFHNRICSLYHRAMVKYLPSLETSNAFTMVLSFLGFWDGSGSGSLEQKLTSLCSFFTCRIRSAKNLQKLLCLYFGIAPFSVQENIPRWAHVENRNTLGNGSSLGGDDILGEAVYDRSGKFRITLGPVDLQTYRSFMPGESNFNALKALVALFADTPLYYELEVRCMHKELIPAALGKGGGRLNRDLALGKEGKGCGIHALRFELDTLYE